MKRLAFIIVVLSFAVVSCKKTQIKPSGDISTEVRNIAAFNEIEVSDAIEVDILQAATQSLKVEANTNLHDFIVTEVIAGKLIIRMKNNVNIKNNPTIKVEVYAVDLKELEASGASKIEVQGSFVTNSLEFKLSGASRLYGNYILNSAEIDASGASNINISGQIDDFEVELSGASSLKGFDMMVQDLDLDLSGASQASLTVNGNMDIKASGASTFYYEGNGVINELNLTGASNVEKN